MRKKSRICGVLYDKSHDIVEPHQLFNTWCGNPIDLVIGAHIAKRVDVSVLNIVSKLGDMFKSSLSEVEKKRG